MTPNVTSHEQSAISHGTAKRVYNPILPVAGNVVGVAAIFAALNGEVSKSTIRRLLKKGLDGEAGGIKAFRVVDGGDLLTTDQYVQAHFKRLNPNWGRR